MGKQRIVYLDLVKLFTIYLVILGHVIAMMVNGYAVGGRLYAFIYSFHMPLFMLLSGYFISNRYLQKPLVEAVATRAKQLLLPAITCTAICLLYLFFARNHINARDEIIGNSWFLKVLFVYYVIFYLLKRLHINDWILFVISCVVLFLFPYGSTLQINLLFPYFWGGYLLRKYNVLVKTSSWAYTSFFVMMYAGGYYLQRLFDIPNYIQISIETIPNMWYLMLLRYFVAFTGCMSVICLFSALNNKIRENKTFLRIAGYGKYTLGVYVLQTILVINVFPDTFAWFVESELLLDVVVAPILSLFFLGACLFLINLFSKNKILDLLMFGGQYYKK